MPTTATSWDLPAAYARATLERNLAALERSDRELAERLRLPVGSDGVRHEPDGGLSYGFHRRWLPLRLSGREVEALVTRVPAGSPTLLLGIGVGEPVEALLCRTAGARLTAWERDPWLLRLFLMRRDVSAALATGRLRLALGIDLLRHVGRPEARVAHPVLVGVYAHELRLLERGVTGARAMMCAGGLFVEDVRRALQARGFSTWTLETERLAAEELARAMRHFRPELVVAINHANGLAEFCREHDTRLLCWEVDPTTSVPRRVDGPTRHAAIFTHRRANVELFRGAGFTNVEYLPLAADPDVRRELELTGEERERLGAPLAFVGSSMVENARACRGRFLAAWTACTGEGARADGEALLERVLAAQRADFSCFVLPEALEREAPGLREAVIGMSDAEDPVLLAGEVAASEKRLAWAAGLADTGLAVWGDAGWRALAGSGVDYRGPAGHRDELTRIYNACPLHWDVGRIYQPDIVTMRVFDVLACGRLVLAEHSPALAELFEVGHEVESYRTPAELRRKLRHYRSHPDEAAAIARRGQAAVRARHTIAQRVDHMLGRLEAPPL